MNLKNRFLSLCCAAVGVVGLLGLGTSVKADPPSGKGYNLVFDDEFSGSAVDTTLWTTQGYPWGSLSHQDQSVKVASQLSVDGGALTITAKPGTVAGQPAQITNTPFGTLQLNYLSGCITSLKRWHKGYFEARIKVPAPTSTWPAFWMLQDGWPPELDIMEIHNTRSSYQYTYHYVPDGATSGNTSAGGTYTGADFSAGWHIFAVEWTDTSLTYYVDGNAVGWFYDAAAIAQMTKMYMLIEDQVGGWSPAPIAAQYPARMQVDYVRVYQITGPAAGLYRLTPKNAQALALQGADSRTANGTVTTVATANATAAQQWNLAPQADGSYILTNNAAPKPALDIAGGSAVSLASVDLNAASGTSTQRWTFTRNTDSSWTLSPATGSYLAAEVRAAATNSNAQIDLGVNTNATNQEWLLQAPSGPLKISPVTVSGVTSSSATFTWTTNYPTDTTLNYGGDVNYGTTQADSTQTTTHTATLSLSSGSVYHVQATATDMYGDKAASPDMQVRTPTVAATGFTIDSFTYTKNANGTITANVVLDNNTYTTWNSVQVTSAVLAGTSTSTAMPIKLGKILRNDGISPHTVTLTLTFPTLKEGVPATINLTGSADGYAFTASFTANK